MMSRADHCTRIRVQLYITGNRQVLTVPYQDRTVRSQRPHWQGYGTLDGRYTGITGCTENETNRKIKIICNIKNKIIFCQ